MKCTDFEKLVNEYVDGELTHSLDLIEEHLENCDACKALYEETLELKSLLSGLDIIDLPDDFEETLHEKLVAVNNENKIKPMDRWRTPIKVIGSIAALAIVSISVYNAMPNGTSDDANFAGITATMSEGSEEMAMDDAAMNSAEEATESAPEAVYSTDVAETESDMTAKTRDVQAYSARLTPYTLTEKTLEYYVNASPQAVEDYIESYETKDLEVLDMQYRFYIHKEDVKAFKEELMLLSSIQIQESIELDNSVEIEYIKDEIAVIETRIAELENEYENAGEEQKSSLKDQIDSEKMVLESYDITLDNIKAYEVYQQIIIFIVRSE